MCIYYRINKYKPHITASAHSIYSILKFVYINIPRMKSHHLRKTNLILIKYGNH